MNSRHLNLISSLSSRDLRVHGSKYLGVPCQQSKRVRQRQRQARYEARQRAGVALYPVPLGATEIDMLIGLGWLPEGAEVDRERVGI